MKKDDMIFIEHMSQSIEDIESFTKGTNKDKFMTQKMMQNAVVRSIEIIGEAVKNLNIDFKMKYPEVEWSKIAGTRDKMIHNYFGINLDMLWNTVKENLPKLKEQIKHIQEKEKSFQKSKKQSL